MKKLTGIALFLLVLYGILLMGHPAARTVQNHFLLGQRIGIYGILSLAAGLLIITGGIDLSIGSVVGLTSVVLAMLLRGDRFPWPLDLLGFDGPMHPALAVPVVLLLGAVIGLINGILVTRLRVQAFVVTLCGLFVYRGAARWIADDEVKGLGGNYRPLKEFLNGDLFGIPSFLVIFTVLALVASVFLHLSVYGRYLFAIGSNERAARYSGIATNRYRILAYVLCSTLTALFGCLFLMWNNQSQPSGTGNFYELYAIAGAVLGGCSLRGGQGTVLGMLIGTSILWILPNLINIWGIPSTLEYAVIGFALLVGAIMDEWLQRGKSGVGG